MRGPPSGAHKLSSRSWVPTAIATAAAGMQGMRSAHPTPIHPYLCAALQRLPHHRQQAAWVPHLKRQLGCARPVLILQIHTQGSGKRKGCSDEQMFTCNRCGAGKRNRL